MIFGMRYRQAGIAKYQGFTLIELVMTMLIVAILAVNVIPRFFDRQLFSSRGFYDQTLAILRFAQKAAIAQRRNVCVAFTSTTVTLTTASSSGDGAACNTNLAGPEGTPPYAITAKLDAKFTDTGGNTLVPNGFTFHASGQASAGQTFRVYGLSQNITVEQETGYVHS